MWKQMILGLLTLICSIPALSQVPVSWMPSQARSLTYDVTIEHGRRQGQPIFVEKFELNVNFDGNGTVEIFRAGRAPSTFATTPGGNLVVSGTVDAPPFISILLLQTLAPDPVQAQAGTRWETEFPRQMDLPSENDKLSIQDRELVTVTSVQDRKASLSVRGETRAIKNAGAARLLGSAIGMFDRLFTWNLSLAGTAMFDANKSAIEAADLFYVLEPIPGLTVDQLKQQESLQHAIVRRID